jgi:hypothetical protein
MLPAIARFRRHRLITSPASLCWMAVLALATVLVTVAGAGAASRAPAVKVFRPALSARNAGLMEPRDVSISTRWSPVATSGRHAGSSSLGA